MTRLIGDVLANETDLCFSWQFDSRYPCPGGCARKSDGAMCGEVKGSIWDEL